MNRIIAVTNQKGGVGKTTTVTNLGQALALAEQKVLLVDLDPQGNATHAMGISLTAIQQSIGDLLREPDLDVRKVIYRGPGIDLIPATPTLSRVEREMVGLTNSELRLAKRLDSLRGNYSYILIDTPPTFGPLLNSALNASDFLVVPVDPGCFAMMGIKELLSEVEAIKQGTNPRIEILGYLLTLVDRTKVATETWDGLIASFGERVFETKIRRSVRLKEAPIFGKTVYQHAPKSSGAEDYTELAVEIIQKTAIKQGTQSSHLSVVGGA